MSKKAPAAATAAEPEKPEVQASVPPADPAPTTPADTPPEPGAETEQPPAAPPEQPPEQVRGRALVDLSAHALKCGEFGTLPTAVAQSLAAGGQFDLKAVAA